MNAASSGLSPMSNDPIHELQMKVAYLEESMSSLSDEFYAQQRELNELKSKYANLISRVRSLPSSDDSNDHSADERPPHY